MLDLVAGRGADVWGGQSETGVGSKARLRAPVKSRGETPVSGVTRNFSVGEGGQAPTFSDKTVSSSSQVDEYRKE